MHISIPIGYLVQGRRADKRVFRPVRLAERVTVQIPEVDVIDAPKAIEWDVDITHEDSRPFSARTHHAGDGRAKLFTRWYAGRHWLRLVERSVSDKEMALRGVELTAQRLEEFLAQDHAHSALGLGCAVHGAKIARDGCDPSAVFEEIRVSGRDEALRSVLALPENVILVGGVVHVACAQPAPARTVAREYRDGSYPALYSVAMRTDHLALDGYDPGLSKILVYGLGEWERLNTQRSDGVVVPPPLVHLEESIDPDIDAHRQVSNLVKVALARWGCPPFFARRFDGFSEELRETTVQSARENSRAGGGCVHAPS
jgi:hypothetical protein